jgi:hypothetical protein
VKRVRCGVGAMAAREQEGSSYNKIQTKKDAVSLQRPFCYTAI